jgi:hypothetical protein
MSEENLRDAVVGYARRNQFMSDKPLPKIPQPKPAVRSTKAIPDMPNVPPVPPEKKPGTQGHLEWMASHKITPTETEIRAQIGEARSELDHAVRKFETLAAWLMAVDFERGVVLANQVKTLRTQIAQMKLEGA